MSARKYIELTCDWDLGPTGTSYEPRQVFVRCPHKFSDREGIQEAKEVRKVAKAAGWVFKYDVDYCPTHKALAAKLAAQVAARKEA